MISNSLARRCRRQAAAVAVIVLAFCHRLPAAPLTLEAALDRVIASHPDLRTFGPRAQVLENEALLAALPRENTLGLVVENAVGAGDFRGFDAAETTLTLAGVLERGGKREARRAMAAARLDELGVERAGVQFDILAETARRYLEVVAWQARQPLAEEQLAQRERMADAARQRFTQGAAPEAAALRAEADVAEGKAVLAGSRMAAEVAGRRLALMWGETAPAAIEVIAPPQELPALPDFPEFRKRLPAAPELARFATTERIRDARVRLAVSARTADLEWQLGVRHFAAGGDLALVGGVSMALGSSGGIVGASGTRLAGTRAALGRDAARGSAARGLVAGGCCRDAGQDCRARSAATTAPGRRECREGIPGGCSGLPRVGRDP
jgi:cobalt-zinc-cadmium efflux system outer membrane protein